MNERVFTDQELRFLAMSGAERMRVAVDTGNSENIRDEFDYLLALYRQFHDLYHGWTTSLFVFINDAYGHEVAKGFTQIEYTLAREAEVGMDLNAVRVSVLNPETSFQQFLDDGDLEGAYEYFLTVERGCRDLHDFYRDYVSFIMSNIYKTYGADAQEQCLRASSEKDWMPWMMEDITHDIRQRLNEWAPLLAVGNFAKIEIEEHPDRIEIVQDPCGSCGRQHRGGRYDSPWSLAVIQEAHPTTYGLGQTHAYRSHIPIMHYHMPMERIGAPWPLIQCPQSKYGQCKITMFKDALQKVPESEARWLDSL